MEISVSLGLSNLHRILNDFSQLRLYQKDTSSRVTNVNYAVAISTEVVIVFDEMVYKWIVHAWNVEMENRIAHWGHSLNAVRPGMPWNTKKWLMVTESLRLGNFQYIFDAMSIFAYVFWSPLTIFEYTRLQASVTDNSELIFFLHYNDHCGQKNCLKFRIDVSSQTPSPIDLSQKTIHRLFSKYHLYL